MAIGDGGMSVPGVRRPFRTLGIASSGLSGQRARIEAIASNIANANSIDENGTPYRRREAVLREAGFDPVLRAQIQGADGGTGSEALPGGVEVAGIQEQDAWTRIYEPNHPQADDDGYVLVPDINVEEEMIDLLSARRLYDANATVFEAVKGMLRRASQI